MSEGTIDEVEVVPAAKPSGWKNWAERRRADAALGKFYQRPEAPPGFRDGKRYVTVPEADVLKRGPYSKICGYNARTVARLVGMHPATIRKALDAKEFSLHDLGSVLRWVIGKVRPGDVAEVDAVPPLWRHYDTFSLLSVPSSPRGKRNHILLAVQMPRGSAREEAVRLFWANRVKIKAFRGASYPLAVRLLELDGITFANLPARPPRKAGVSSPRKRDPHPEIHWLAKTLRGLVTLGVLTYDKDTGVWAMAPFPVDLEGTLAGLREEGFVAAEIVERHIVIGPDWLSLAAGRRLLAYMRTNRLKAKDCGRDRRLWIITGMDRVMHGYRERQIFRRQHDDRDEAGLFLPSSGAA